MPASLADQLVVAISSRALFDFEEENRHFEANDDRAYMQLQLERIDQAATPGVAFSLVQKLLAFNDATTQRVEVVILSRNDPVSGMRVFRSAQAGTAFRSIAIVGGLSYGDAGLEPATEYRYQVRASNGGAISGLSDTVTRRTRHQVPPCSEPGTCGAS